MQNAPSVMYPVGRCALHGGVLSVLALSSALLLAGWWWYTPPSWMGLAGMLGWSLWLCFAGRSWWRSPVGYLRWRPLAREGSSPRAGAWVWHDEPNADGVALQHLELVLDLQHWVLLRCRGAPTPAVHWVWAERARDPARWGDLRRALVASRN